MQPPEGDRRRDAPTRSPLAIEPCRISSPDILVPGRDAEREPFVDGAGGNTSKQKPAPRKRAANNADISSDEPAAKKGSPLLNDHQGSKVASPPRPPFAADATKSSKQEDCSTFSHGHDGHNDGTGSTKEATESEPSGVKERQQKDHVAAGTNQHLEALQRQCELYQSLAGQSDCVQGRRRQHLDSSRPHRIISMKEDNAIMIHSAPRRDHNSNHKRHHIDPPLSLLHQTTKELGLYLSPAKNEGTARTGAHLLSSTTSRFGCTLSGKEICAIAALGLGMLPPELSGRFTQNATTERQQAAGPRSTKEQQH